MEPAVVRAVRSHPCPTSPLRDAASPPSTSRCATAPPSASARWSPSDEHALRDFLDELSIESRWLRFFSAGADLHRAASLHGRARAGAGPRACRRRRRAGADRARTPRTSARRPARAEVAFEVADEWQGRGISTVLLAHLSELATAEGIEHVHRRGAAGQPPDDPGVPRLRVRRRGPSRVPGELTIELPGRARGGGAERASRSATTSPRQRPSRTCCAPRRSRSSACRPARDRSARPCCAIFARPATSGRLSVVHPREDVVGGLPAHRSIADVPGARRAGRDRGAGRGRRARSRASAARPACARSWCSRPASRRSAGAAATSRPSCSPSAARAGCGSSGRTASACSTRPADVGLERDVRAGRAAGGRRRVRVPERRVRHRGDRRGGAPRARPVVVRVDRQQGRPLRQRLPAVLGGRRRRPT